MLLTPGTGTIRWQTVVLLLCLAALAGALLATGELDNRALRRAGSAGNASAKWYSMSPAERLKAMGSGLRK